MPPAPAHPSNQTDLSVCGPDTAAASLLLHPTLFSPGVSINAARSARPPSPFRGRAPTLYLYLGLPALPGLCLSQCSPPLDPLFLPFRACLSASPACTCTIITSTHRLGPCCTSPPPTTTTNHTLAVPTTTRCCCTLYHQLYHPLPVPCSGPVAQPPPSLPHSGSALLVLLLR